MATRSELTWRGFFGGLLRAAAVAAAARYCPRALAAPALTVSTGLPEVSYMTLADFARKHGDGHIGDIAKILEGEPLHPLAQMMVAATSAEPRAWWKIDTKLPS